MVVCSISSNLLRGCDRLLCWLTQSISVELGVDKGETAEFVLSNGLDHADVGGCECGLLLGEVSVKVVHVLFVPLKILIFAKKSC